MAFVVSVKDLVFRYGQQNALSGISFSLESGKRLGLIGPNGGGKSTLMKLLSTTLPIQAGEIFFDGQSIAHQASQVRSRLGVVFQTSTLDKKLTVKENLTLMARLQSLSRLAAEKRIDFLAGTLALTDRLNAKVESLSGGLKRRAELALALLHQPKLLLLDEPTTGLDPLVRREFWTLLNRIVQEEKVSFIVATHLLDEAEFCDELALIHRGKIFAKGTPQSFLDQNSSDLIAITARHPQETEKEIRERFAVKEILVAGNDLQFELKEGRHRVGQIMETLGKGIEAITVKRAGLESFFLKSVSEVGTSAEGRA